MTRLYCSRCLRPKKTCFCALTQKAPSKTRVTILQHPNEYRHSKNSAHFLHLSLPNSRLITGLDFASSDVLLDSTNNLLLYPNSKGSNPCNSIETTSPTRNRPNHLLVLDGTWRNSRQLLHRNPWLKTLPRFSLSSQHKSVYHVRKAQNPAQLSTFEATCYALEILEDANFASSLLMQSFQQFVNQIAGHHPSKAAHYQE